MRILDKNNNIRTNWGILHLEVGVRCTGFHVVPQKLV